MYLLYSCMCNGHVTLIYYYQVMSDVWRCSNSKAAKIAKAPSLLLCCEPLHAGRPNGPWRKDSKTGRPRAENVMMLGLRLGWALQRCRNGEDAVAGTQPHAGKLRQLALWCKRLEPKSPLVDTWMSRSCHSTKIGAIKNLGLLHSRWATTAWRWQWQCLGASSRWDNWHDFSVILETNFLSSWEDDFPFSDLYNRLVQPMASFSQMMEVTRCLS